MSSIVLVLCHPETQERKKKEKKRGGPRSHSLSFPLTLLPPLSEEKKEKRRKKKKNAKSSARRRRLPASVKRFLFMPIFFLNIRPLRPGRERGKKRGGGGGVKEIRLSVPFGKGSFYFLSSCLPADQAIRGKKGGRRKRSPCS